MRLIVARCTASYTGRLTTHLPEGVRLLMIKEDGTLMLWSDGGSSSVKPLKGSLPLDFGRHLAFSPSFSPWLLATDSGLSPIKPSRRGLRGNGVQLPWAGDPLEVVGASVIEGDARTDHGVLDGLRDEYLVRPGERADSGPDVHGDPAETVANDLAFSGVNASPHV